MHRALGAVLVVLFCGCVAQVRGARVQKPFLEAPEGTRIALVSIDVPSWVEDGAPKTDAPGEQVEAALLSAFDGKSFQVVDELNGYTIPIGPDTKPIVLPTAASVAELGRPYPFDADGVVQAVGAPPISWKVISAPTGFAVDAESGRVTWTPSRTGEQEIELAAINRRGQTPYKFTVTVVEQGKAGARTLAKPYGPAIGADQAYTSYFPKPLPASIDAPLLLAVHVVSWTEGSDVVMKTTRRKAFTDVVYSLWTREGREVETRRVRLDAVPIASFRNAVTFVPERSLWLRWTDATELPVRMAPLEEKELFPTVAKANAAAFAFPYGEHKMMFSVQLDESSPALKPGIELSNKEDYAGAYRAFEEAAKANPKLAGAYFNMGVMREVQGQDAEAAALYRKALDLNPNEGLYQRQVMAIEDRVKHRKPLELH